MGDNDKISKMIAHRIMQQERKNDQKRLHRNKIDNDRLGMQVQHIEWNKTIRSKDFASSKIIFLKRFERLYARRQEIEENRKTNQTKKTMNKLKQERNNKTPIRVATTKSSKEEEGEETKLTEASENKIKDKEERKIQSAVASKDRKNVLIEKILSLSGGYRDNDPPLIYYKQKGMIPPDKFINQVINQQPVSTNTYTSTTKQIEDEDLKDDFTEDNSEGKEMEKINLNQNHSVRRKSLKKSERPKTAITFDEASKMKKKSVPIERKRSLKRTSINQRPRTTEGRIFTSSSTHLSEVEQDYVKRRIRQKSACIRHERARTLNMVRSAPSGERLTNSFNCGGYRLHSTMDREDGRRFIEYLSKCKQSDLDAGVADLQIKAKKLLIAATKEYNRCLQQDVLSFISTFEQI